MTSGIAGYSRRLSIIISMISVYPAFIGNFYLKLYFANGGLEIKSARLIKTKDMEEEYQRGLTELE